MKKALIMGGSYFIGKHVVDALKKDYQVTVLNRGSNPLNDPLINEITCDRNDGTLLKSLLKNTPFHYVVDISGYTKTQSELLLDALDLNSLETFVYISTSAAYNIQVLTPPFKETDALGGDSPFKDYAKNKIEAEQYLTQKLSEKALIIFRPPIVYGEDNYILRERLAFYLVEHNLPIYVPKSDNTLSFVYVKDLAQEVKLSLQGNIPSGIYNVGNTSPLTFTQWVNLCAKVMKKSPVIVYVDEKNPLLDVRYYFPFFTYDNILSVKKIKTYSPSETPFETGLKRAYDDYLTLEEPIKIPQKMLKMRETIKAIINH